MSRSQRRLQQFEPKQIRRGFWGSSALHVFALLVLGSVPIAIFSQLDRESPPQIGVELEMLMPTPALPGLPQPAPEVEVVPPEDYEARLKEAEMDSPLDLDERVFNPSPLQSWPVTKQLLTNPNAYQKPPVQPSEESPTHVVTTITSVKPIVPKVEPDPPATVPEVAIPPSNPASPPSGLSQRPDPEPDPKASPDPQYPWQALRRRLQGVVQILVEVDSSGKVVNARVAQTSGHGILDRAALDAVKKWTFLPALKDGVAVPGAAVIPIRFHFKDRN
jgi:periplasmic protein TonB